MNSKNKSIALNDGEPTTSSLARFFLPQAQHRKNLAKLPNRYKQGEEKELQEIHINQFAEF